MPCLSKLTGNVLCMLNYIGISLFKLITVCRPLTQQGSQVCVFTADIIVSVGFEWWLKCRGMSITIRSYFDVYVVTNRTIKK